MTTHATQITVVSGLPRSGTSLMMQMLEAGGIPPLTDRTRTADEDNPRGYYELEAVKQTTSDASWLDRAPGHAVKIVHILLEMLPSDRPFHVIFMKRNLEEVVRSQRVMLDRHGKAGAKLPAEKLIQVYEMQYFKTEAWIARQSNVESLTVDYNALVRDPGSIAAEVNAFLGGTLDVAAMTGVVDPSLYRQRG